LKKNLPKPRKRRGRGKRVGTQKGAQKRHIENIKGDLEGKKPIQKLAQTSKDVPKIV